MGTRRGVRRLTLKEAAEELSISKDAVRQRIRRKSLSSDKGEDGRVYVYLDATAEGVRDQGEQPEDRTAELIATLKEQLEAERRAHAEARQIIMSLSQANAEQARTLRALEAPPDERDEPEMVEEEASRGAPRSDASGRQTPTPRPWWRRIFGG